MPGQDTIKEEWKPVVGYEGMYEVSDLGRVRAMSRVVRCRGGYARKSEKILKLCEYKKKQKRSYLYVDLCKEGVISRKSVHHLVLEAFVGPREGDQVCRHFPDNDVQNNRLENLQWGSKEENEKDKFFHGTNRQSLTPDDVRVIRLLCQASDLHFGQIGALFGVKIHTVYCIHGRRTWKHLQ